MLQVVKERGGLGLPDWKLYLADCCIEREDVVRSSRLLELEEHNLRFGWHEHLWYDEAKVNVDFKNYCVREAIPRVWNNYNLVYA